MEDPKTELIRASQQVRDALRELREGVVQAVMLRNRLQDEVQRLDAQIADLQTKANLAAQINNASLSDELLRERQRRIAERDQLANQLEQAKVNSEAAKQNQVVEEARLLGLVNTYKVQLAQLTGAQIDTNASPADSSSTEAAWSRANEKIRTMMQEAEARQELHGGMLPGADNPAPLPTADELLADLERRAQNSPAPQSQQGAPASVPDAGPLSSGLVNYIEFTQEPEAPAPVPAPAPSPEPAPVPQPPLAPELVNPPSLSLVEGGVDPARTTVANQNVTPADVPSWSTLRQSQGDSSKMETARRVRVAGIGTGGIFRGAHLPAYADIPQMQFVAICDPDKEAQDLAHKRFISLTEARIKQANDQNDLARVEQLERDLESLVIVEDLSQVISDVKPDICDICTQPFLHAPLSIQALEAGINVMTEKPISRSWLETERLLPAIERSGKLYQHNENWLFDPDYYTARKLVTSGIIGEPIAMFLAQAHGGPEGNGKFWNPGFGGGGALLDNGIHAIGAAWFVCGLDKKPTYVKAAEPFGMSIRFPDRIIDGRLQRITVDDDDHILIRFEDEKTNAWVTAHIEGSWSERDSPDTVIIGSTGRIVFRNEEDGRYAVAIDSFERESRRLRCTGMTWSPWPSSHYGEILNFVECVRSGQPSICTGQFGADNSAIVGAAYLSEKRGKKAVHIEEFKAFAREIAARHPGDPAAADDELVDQLLAAVREKL